MRIKLRLYATALALAALGVLVCGTAVATAHGKGKDSLRLAATEIQSEFLDLGASGPSLGDEIVFSEALFRRGREVGASGGVCTATGVVAPYDVLTFNCVVTLSLRRGQITLQALIEIQGEDDPGPFILAITGGTGEFRGASGEARFRDVSETRSVYKLRLDSRDKHHGKRHGKRHRR